MTTSCVRIDPKDFHGADANAFTEQCLAELAESKQFKAYVKHIDYKERLHLTWFLVPLGLLSVFYYHLSVFTPEFLLPMSNMTTTALEERASAAQGLPHITLFVLLGLLPSAIVAPFSGFFEEPSRGESVRLFVLLTLVNVAVASYGGPMLHHPPFTHAAPAIPWLSIFSDRVADSRGLTVAAALRVLAVRTLPMQGFLASGYAVSQWQRAFWRRAWHLPFPLVSVPALVGLCGVAWWRVASLALPYFFSADGTLTNAATYSWETALTDPSAVASLWRSIAREVAAAVGADVRGWVTAGHGLPALLVEPVSCVHAYLSVVGMSVVYFTCLAVRPLVEFVVGGACLLLPVDPTIWGLTVLSAAGGLAALLRMEELALPYVAGVSSLLLLLLYNGFVA